MSTEPDSSRTTTAAVPTPRAGRALLVRTLVGFWALWWSLVFLTNAFDGLVELGVLGDGWAFASGNYQFLRSITAVYALPEPAVAVIFGIGVLWELAVAILCWRALVAVACDPFDLAPVYLAFVPAVGFFAAFTLLTELFLAYDLAGTHVGLFVATLLTLVAIELVVSGRGDR
ncbi:hypothetical protein AB7C87_08430 [Natrarchaeobius sp. A-rgal3]|uniref:hypothetical protein n=1 Tax=Natrarchaeobius versutus TaxID=1679078 RepID=UPI00350FFA9F